MTYLPWVNLILGVWLLIAPFALGFSESFYALWNSVVIGALAAIVGILTIRREWAERQ